MDSQSLVDRQILMDRQRQSQSQSQSLIDRLPTVPGQPGSSLAAFLVQVVECFTVGVGLLMGSSFFWVLDSVAPLLGTLGVIPVGAAEADGEGGVPLLSLCRALLGHLLCIPLSSQTIPVLSDNSN